MRYIRLALDFYHPWANNVGFYLGRDLGFYADAGIDLDIVSYDPYRGDSLGRLIAGEVEFAFNYPNRLMKRNEEGARLLSVAACNDRSFEALLFDDRREIRDFADLEGKVVGVPRSPRVRKVLRYMVAKAGKNPDLVRFREVFPDEPDPCRIASGDFDCVYGTFWGWEGVLARMESEHIRWKEVSELGAPYCHQHLIAVRRELAESEPELVAAFLDATHRGYQAAADDPERASRSMVMVAPYYTPLQFQRAIEAIRRTWRLEAWGVHDVTLIESYAKWLAEHDLLEAAGTHAQDDFSDAFLPKSSRARGESGA